MKSFSRFVFSAAIALFAAAPLLAQQNTDWAKERLEKSPRHVEWVKVSHDNRDVNCFVAYPEVKDKAPAVIVIHEIFGLTTWVDTVADQLAEAGYIAIAPDLLWGKGPNGEGTEAMVKNNIQPTSVIGSLPPDQITADLNAVADYVKKLPSCNGQIYVCGFCWGGGQTFRYATNNKDVKAAFAFYGEAPRVGRGGEFVPDEDALKRIVCPVYGFYAGNDNRIDASIPATTEAMKKLNKTYEPVTYEGAGHGFMRDGQDTTSKAPQHEANVKARDEAWTRWKEVLKKN
jgi:carboxymethylenebutenolidase